jgi:hypothetical protein
MDINQAAKLLMDECVDIDIEINVTENNVDIYWGNLNVQVKPSQLKKTLTAIKYLHGIGAHFQ